MKKTFQLVVALIFLFGCKNTQSQNTIDFSSVNAFFKIANQLSENRLPLKSEWDSLFNTNGYSALSKSKTRNNQYKSLVLMAFYEKDYKKCANVLNITLRNDKSNLNQFFSKFVLNNYLDMKLNYKQLVNYAANYNFNQKMNLAQIQLKKFLKNPVDSLIVSPKLFFACFEPDGYSNEKGLVLDLNLCYRYSNEEFTSFMAHEMFHTYRSNFENSKFYQLNEFTKQIDKLQNEGIADLIDKKGNGYKSELIPEPLRNMYANVYSNTNKKLKELDLITTQYLDEKITKQKFNSLLKKYFVFGGHPNGLFMARLIVASNKKDELITRFYNPISFLKLYNEATKKKFHEAVFSDKFMIYLNDLEEKYFR